jgi:hypothetical protein
MITENGAPFPPGRLWRPSHYGLRSPAVHRRHLAVPVLRLLGLLCSTVLILRVIVAIRHDGLN